MTRLRSVEGTKMVESVTTVATRIRPLFEQKRKTAARKNRQNSGCSTGNNFKGITSNITLICRWTKRFHSILCKSYNGKRYLIFRVRFSRLTMATLISILFNHKFTFQDILLKKTGYSWVLSGCFSLQYDIRGRSIMMHQGGLLTPLKSVSHSRGENKNSFLPWMIFTNFVSHIIESARWNLSGDKLIQFCKISRDSFSKSVLEGATVVLFNLICHLPCMNLF